MKSKWVYIQILKFITQIVSQIVAQWFTGACQEWTNSIMFSLSSNH